ncbi:MAG: glycosyltransferase family 4 protein [Elusimicrobiota bacterium]|nr:glycosyltransferase family 4 protein [Elusimicrobiota bacterium]
MRICMLIPRFYPVMGGTENQCSLLSKQLVKMGHGVFVLTQREKNTAAHETLDGVDVYRLPGFALPGIFSFGFFFSALFSLLSNRVKYDLIHVHLATSAALAAVLAGMILGKGCVVKFAGAGRTGDIGTSRGKPWGRLKLYMLKKSRALFTAPSDEVAGEMVSAGFNEGAVIKIPNGVDCDFYSPAGKIEKEELKENMGWQGKKVFLFAGRLEEPKDITFFLNAWEASSNDYGLFIIAGSGSQEKALKALVEKKKIKNVVFAGKRNDMLRLYRASDYFVLPSRAEGLSNSLLEAMSCGLTAIASDIAANREIIEDGRDGVLFSFDREGELEKIIKNLLQDAPANDSVRRMGDAAREKIMRKYSISAVAENHVNKVYGRLREKFGEKDNGE